MAYPSDIIQDISGKQNLGASSTDLLDDFVKTHGSTYPDLVKKIQGFRSKNEYDADILEGLKGKLNLLGQAPEKIGEAGNFRPLSQTETAVTSPEMLARNVLSGNATPLQAGPSAFAIPPEKEKEAVGKMQDLVNQGWQSKDAINKVGREMGISPSTTTTAPVTSGPQGGFLAETAKRGMEQYFGGMSHLARTIDSMGDYVNKLTGGKMDKGGLFEKMATLYESNEKYWKEREGKVGPGFMGELLASAVGGGVPGVAEFASGPFNSALAAASEADKANKPVASAAIRGFGERYVLGNIFSVLNRLRFIYRAGGMGTVMGGQAALEGGGAREIAKGAGTGILYAVGPRAQDEIKPSTSIPGDAMRNAEPATATGPRPSEGAPREEKGAPEGGKGTQPNASGAAETKPVSELPAISKIRPEIKRIMAANPGMTLKQAGDAYLRGQQPMGTGTESTSGLTLPSPEAVTGKLEQRNKIQGGPTRSEVKGFGLPEAPAGTAISEGGTAQETGLTAPVHTDHTTYVAGLARGNPAKGAPAAGNVKFIEVDPAVIEKEHPDLNFTQYAVGGQEGFRGLDKNTILITPAAEKDPVLFDKALAEKKVYDRGGTEAEALAAGNKVELRERERAEGFKPSKKLTETEKDQVKSEIAAESHLMGIDNNGNKILKVPGAKAELLIPNFTEGGHDLVYKGVIPDKTIWIDDRNTSDDITPNTMHEVQERQRMENGEKYNKAHNESLQDEWNSRHGLPVEPVVPRTPKTPIAEPGKVGGDQAIYDKGVADARARITAGGEPPHGYTELAQGLNEVLKAHGRGDNKNGLSLTQKWHNELVGFHTAPEGPIKRLIDSMESRLHGWERDLDTSWQFKPERFDEGYSSYSDLTRLQTLREGKPGDKTFDAKVDSLIDSEMKRSEEYKNLRRNSKAYKETHDRVLEKARDIIHNQDAAEAEQLSKKLEGRFNERIKEAEEAIAGLNGRDELTKDVEALRPESKVVKKAREAVYQKKDQIQKKLDYLKEQLADVTKKPEVSKAELVKEKALEPKKAEAPKAGKKPWEMTREEYVQSGMTPMAEGRGDKMAEALRKENEENHKQFVRDAIARGEKIPSEVLKDYPDLSKKAETPKAEGKRQPSDIDKQVASSFRIQAEEAEGEVKKALLKLADMHEGKIDRPESLTKIYTKAQIEDLVGPKNLGGKGVEAIRKYNELRKARLSDADLKSEKAINQARADLLGTEAPKKGARIPGVRGLKKEKPVGEIPYDIKKEILEEIKTQANKPGEQGFKKMMNDPAALKNEIYDRYKKRISKERAKLEEEERMPLSEWEKANIGPNKIHKTSGRTGEEILRAADEAYRKREETKKRMGAGGKERAQLTEPKAGDFVTFTDANGKEQRGKVRDYDSYSKTAWIFPADKSLIPKDRISQARATIDVPLDKIKSPEQAKISNRGPITERAIVDEDGLYNTSASVEELHRGLDLLYRMAGAPSRIIARLRGAPKEYDLRTPEGRDVAKGHMSEEEIDRRLSMGDNFIYGAASTRAGVNVKGVAKAEVEFSIANQSGKSFIGSVGHEGAHVLDKAYFTDHERSLLDQGVREIEKKFSNDPRYKELIDHFKDRDSEEKRSYLIEDFVKNPSKYNNQIKGILGWFRKMTIKLGNWLQGNGFRSWEDLAKAMVSGEFREKAESKARAAGGPIPGTRAYERAKTRLKTEEAPSAEGEEERRRAAGIPENLHPIEMPELLRYFKGLGHNGQIKLVKAIRLMGGKVLGTFFPKTGNINLARDLFKNAALAARVFSHELGHLADWIPDKTTLRGNILGHIASLKDYMGKYLEEYPGAPGKPLTNQDVADLKAEAKRQSEERAPKVDAKITPEDIKNVWTNISAKNPGLEDYIKGLSDKQKGDLVRAAMKGKIPDWFSYSEAGKATNKSAQEIFERLVMEEVRKRRLMDVDEIRTELKHFTQTWNPFVVNRSPDYTKYRHSSEELYADALSGLFQNPDMLKRIAPKFTEGFFNYLERKPEVKANYDAIQNVLRQGPEEVSRVRDIEEKKMQAEYEERAKIRPAEIYGRWSKIRSSVLDRFESVYNLLGEDKETMAKVRGSIHNMVYGDSEALAHAKEVIKFVIRPLQEAKVDPGDFESYIKNTRIAYERESVGQEAIAEPQGFNEKVAKEQLDFLKKKVGKDKWQAMIDAQKNWNNERQLHIIPIVEASEMYKQALIDKMKNNKFWATFSPTHFLENGFGVSFSGRIFGRKGTLENVGNAFTNSLYRDVAVIKSVNRNKALQATADGLLKIKAEGKLPEGSFIEKAPKVWNGRNWVPKEPNKAGQGMIVYMHEGKAEGYYVPKEIERSFAGDPEGGFGQFVSWLSWANKPFRQLFINKRPGFWAYNLLRDLQSGLRTVPGAAQHPLAFTATWLKEFPSAWKGVKDYDLETQEALRKKEVIASFDRAGENDQDTQLDKFLQENGYFKHEEANGVYQNLKKFAISVSRGMDMVAAAGERPTKLAADKWLRQRYPNMSEQEIAWHVRQAGSPMFLTKGLHTPLTNNVIFLSNAAAQAYKTQWEYAKLDPIAFGAKALAYGAIPRLVMWMAGAGLIDKMFGDEIEKKFGVTYKHLYDMIPRFQKNNYLSLPIGVTKGDKAVFFTVPQDEQTRLIGGIIQSIFEGVHSWDDMQQIFNTATSQGLPGVAPAYNLGMTISNALSGQNSYDNFRGQPVITDQQLKAGGKDKWAALGKYIWNTQGGSIIGRFNTENPESIKGELEKMLNAPITSDVIGRLIKVSNYGITERIREAQQPQVEKEARESLRVKDMAAKINEGKTSNITQEELSAAALHPQSLVENVKRGSAHRNNQVYLERFLQAPSQMQKMEVLKQWAEDKQPIKPGIRIPGVRY